MVFVASEREASRPSQDIVFMPGSWMRCAGRTECHTSCGEGQDGDMARVVLFLIPSASTSCLTENKIVADCGGYVLVLMEKSPWECHSGSGLERFAVARIIWLWHWREPFMVCLSQHRQHENGQQTHKSQWI